MQLSVEDLDDQSKYQQILTISYNDLLPFVMDYLRKKSGLIMFFWSACLFLLILAIIVRVTISGYFPERQVLFHTFLGLIVFPVLSIPVHEFLHIIPYFSSGAKNIRTGMNLKQYMFYVTAHRFVTSPLQFKIVALTPFLVISVVFTLLIFFLPGLWKWSISLFLFVHSTSCAGDFALLNFYFLNRNKKIYTWDDADAKKAYFYEQI